MKTVISFLRDHLCEFVSKLPSENYNTLRAWHHKAADLIEAQAALLSKVIAERDELRKDAERYRWLRDNYLPLRWMKSQEQPDGGWVFFKLWSLGEYWKWADTKDDAIDAAMKEQS